MSTRAKATSAQLNHLVEFMKVNHDCAAGRGNGLQGKVELERQWHQLSETLNALGGPVKTVDKWKQTWRDLRNSVKKKAIKNKKEFKGDVPGGTGNGHAQLEVFTAQDEALMSVIGPVAIYGMEGVPYTMDVDDISSTQIEVMPRTIEPTPSTSMCSNGADIEATIAVSPIAAPSIAAPPIAAPPISATPSLANAPPRSRIRSRRRITARTEGFDSQILEFEKERLESKKRQIVVEEKKLELEERRLLIEEAKVKAFERIATALEQHLKK